MALSHVVRRLNLQQDQSYYFRENQNGIVPHRLIFCVLAANRNDHDNIELNRRVLLLRSPVSPLQTRLQMK